MIFSYELVAPCLSVTISGTLCVPAVKGLIVVFPLIRKLIARIVVITHIHVRYFLTDLIFLFVRFEQGNRRRIRCGYLNAQYIRFAPLPAGILYRVGNRMRARFVKISSSLPSARQQ